MAHLISALLALGLSFAQVMPVWDGTLPPADSVKGNDCNVAEVSGLPKGRIFVRERPSQSSKATDALPTGKRVFVCNSARYWRNHTSYEWLGIAYQAPGKSCSGASRRGLDVRLTRACRTGWVDGRWVTVLTG